MSGKTTVTITCPYCLGVIEPLVVRVHRVLEERWKHCNSDRCQGLELCPGLSIAVLSAATAAPRKRVSTALTQLKRKRMVRQWARAVWMVEPREETQRC